jgi:hypothetical protein
MDKGNVFDMNLVDHANSLVIMLAAVNMMLGAAEQVIQSHAAAPKHRPRRCKDTPRPNGIATMLFSSSQARMQALVSTAKQARLFTALILQRKIRKFFQSPRRFAINRTHSTARPVDPPSSANEIPSGAREIPNIIREVSSRIRGISSRAHAPKPDPQNPKQVPQSPKPGPTQFEDGSPQTVSLFANAMHGARSIIIPSETYEGF